MLITYSIDILLSSISLIIASAVFIVSWRYVPYTAIRQGSAYQHLVLGCLVFLSLSWLGLRFDVEGVIGFHPLLITSVTLLLGLPLTIIIGSFATLIVTLGGDAPLNAIGVNIIISVLAPALFSRVLVYLIRRSGVQNLFLYTLGAGFGGGALSMLACALSSLLICWLIDPVLFDVNLESVSLYFLLLFPEAFINGTLITSLAVMHPQLVKTYDDNFYLKKPD